MHCDVARMFFDDVAHIVQAQSKPFYRLGITLRDPEKLFEYVLNELLRYSHPIVPDLYSAVMAVFNNININVNRFPGILDGIIYNIMKGCFQVKPVTMYEYRPFTA